MKGVTTLLIALGFVCTSAPAQAPKKSTPAKTAPSAGKPKPVPAPAENTKPEPSKTKEFPISRLTVNGNKIFSTEKILRAAGLKIGDPANEKVFEAARDRLVRCGYFETVGFQFGPAGDGQGYAASFDVMEIAQSYTVRFDRMKKPDAELLSILQKADPLFENKAPGTKQLLERYAKLLEPSAGERVIGQVMPGNGGELNIVFQPARMPPSVAEVDFEKNSVITTTALRNAVAGTAVGSVFEEQRFRQILDASLKPLYEARGRLRVAFPKITASPSSGVSGLKVTVEVSEGESYQMGELTLENNTALPRADLLRVADLKKGDIANMVEVNAALDRMKDVMRRRGYLKAKVEVERKIDDQKKVLDLLAKIDPGRQYTFSKLDIKGLDILSEPHIRKMWGVKPGQPFNPDYPDHFLKSVREEGLFDNLGKTKSESKVDDATGQVDVLLIFTGEAPQPKKKPEPTQQQQPIPDPFPYFK